ncbi:MAG: mandelate racemase/muconate lactonizing enzyme family protein [Anaerolineae bacterium]|nr:mandelate racemase/muconate lactonizing enzyme family protein [Anaerolineae bacterium]
MSRISRIRPVLLSAPYAWPGNLEVQRHLPTGYRTIGLVEVTLDDGTTGLGEGYLAVFAPAVFVAIVDLIAPYLLGRDANQIHARYRDMCQVTDYWSLQGAARHVISALEIALLDARAKQLGVPAHALLGGRAVEAMRLYGSGGDSITLEDMQAELDLLSERGIGVFKIRARNHQVDKTVWTLDHAARRGIAVAVDMTQNLANPAQTVGDVVRFLDAVQARTAHPLFFLEEALGPADVDSFPALRARTSTRIAGGEIVTTAQELCQRVRRGLYDLAQPDATVIGGVYQTLEVFAACRQHGCETVVHCWGSAVGLLANYHAAFAGGGRLAEWPMPAYDLREVLLVEPLRIQDGALRPPTAPGLGVQLTPEIEARYPFRPDAVYMCFPNPSAALLDESVWQD